MIHGIARQHHQRAPGPQPHVQQRLPGRFGRRRHLAVSPGPPATLRITLGDQPIVRISRRPPPQAAQHARIMLRERHGRPQQPCPVTTAVCLQHRPGKQAVCYAGRGGYPAPGGYARGPLTHLVPPSARAGSLNQRSCYRLP